MVSTLRPQMTEVGAEGEVMEDAVEATKTPMKLRSARINKKIVKTLGVYIVVVLLTLVITSSIVLAQQTVRYYAGYTFGKGYYGVSGDIYTINPSVQGSNFIAQWVTIIISHSREYWIQVGYNKGFDTQYKLKFYVEKMDANGYSIIWVSSVTPSPSTTYTYIIVGGVFNNKYGWEVTIRRGIDDLYSTVIYTNPYTAEDLQAFSETTTTKINIDNTHFSSLSYYTGRSFPLWDQHSAHVDKPYWIQEISDYEFKAGGGG